MLSRPVWPIFGALVLRLGRRPSPDPCHPVPTAPQEVGNVAIPSILSRGRIRLLVVGLLLAVAALLVAPAAAAPRGGSAPDVAATADRLTRPSAPRRPGPTWTPRAG